MDSTWLAASQQVLGVISILIISNTSSWTSPVPEPLSVPAHERRQATVRPSPEVQWQQGSGSAGRNWPCQTLLSGLMKTAVLTCSDPAVCRDCRVVMVTNAVSIPCNIHCVYTCVHVFIKLILSNLYTSFVIIYFYKHPFQLSPYDVKIIFESFWN